MEHHERLVPGTLNWKLNIAGHMMRYHFASQFVAGKRVLDAGCGVGYGSGILLRAGASEVIGVDISEETLEIARKQFYSPGIRFMREDCESLASIDGMFDVIVALECVEHFQQPRRFLGRSNTLLLDSGVLVCSTPNNRFTEMGVAGKPGNPYHVKEYDPEGFRSLLMEFFSDTFLLGQRLTAAYLEVMHLAEIRSNPFIRLGRLLQRLSQPRLATVETIAPTEGDFVISGANLDDAFVFLSVCRAPRRGGPLVGPTA